MLLEPLLWLLLLLLAVLPLDVSSSEAAENAAIREPLTGEATAAEVAEVEAEALGEDGE